MVACHSVRWLRLLAVQVPISMCCRFYDHYTHLSLGYRWIHLTIFTGSGTFYCLQKTLPGKIDS